MSDPLQYDPRTKIQIKDLLYQSLYSPVDVSFKKRIDDIVAKNSSLISSPHRSFVYRGEVYSLETTKPPPRINRLVAELRPTMDEYLNDLKHINDNELPYVMSFFNQILNASDSLQDYLTILPETLHLPINKLMQTCPCKAHSLTEAKVQEIRSKNSKPLSLIGERRARNLLL